MTRLREIWSQQERPAKALIGGVVGLIVGIPVMLVWDQMSRTPVPEATPAVTALIGAGLVLIYSDRPQWEGSIGGGASVTSSRGTPLVLPNPAEGAVITRSFRGRPETTSADAAEYLAHIQPLGWSEVSRTYTPGQWGCGAFLIALLLAIILIGILIFIYLIVVKPDGTLVVTYSRTAT